MSSIPTYLSICPPSHPSHLQMIISAHILTFTLIPNPSVNQSVSQSARPIVHLRRCHHVIAGSTPATIPVNSFSSRASHLVTSVYVYVNPQSINCPPFFTLCRPPLPYASRSIPSKSQPPVTKPILIISQIGKIRIENNTQ